MARMARFKIGEGEGWYHVHAKVAGREGEYLLEPAMCRRKLLDTLRFYAGAYCCEVAAVCVMGNHWHAVLHFQPPVVMENDALVARARLLYPGEQSEKWLAAWTPAQWDRLRSRLFDVSELMRNVQSHFARWYNKSHRREGRFWADRFKSTVLENEKAVLDCLLYVELNPVRAGIVTRPEAYKGSSAFLREIGKAEWLLDLQELIGAKNKASTQKEHKALLYYRGGVPTKRGHAAIPAWILRKEEARGFATAGVFRKRLRYFGEGVMLGAQEAIREQLDRLRECGHYHRRAHPIEHLAGLHHTLREQRSHAFRP